MIRSFVVLMLIVTISVRFSAGCVAAESKWPVVVKVERIRESERPAAKAAYDKAREIYAKIAMESPDLP